MTEDTLQALQRVLADYSMLQIERKLLLVIGELCEAHEELRNGHGVKDVYTNDPSQALLSKPEGFPIECADAHIRLLDLLQSCGIDAEEMIRVKHRYNETRPHKHGRSF